MVAVQTDQTCYQIIFYGPRQSATTLTYEINRRILLGGKCHATQPLNEQLF